MANKSKNPRYKEQGVKSVSSGRMPATGQFSPVIQTPNYPFVGPYLPEYMPSPIDTIPTFEMPPMQTVPAYDPIQYAPRTTSDGGGSYGQPDYNYWYNMAQDQEQWTPEEQAAYLAQFYGQTDEQGNLTYVGNPRFGDPYQVMPYWKYDQPTWVGGREGGAMSKGGGRMPQRYYIPKQEFYKTPGGKTYASRDGWEDAFGKDEKPANNRNESIPAWVGPLVNWRT